MPILGFVDYNVDDPLVATSAYQLSSKNTRIVIGILSGILAGIILMICLLIYTVMTKGRDLSLKASTIDKKKHFGNTTSSDSHSEMVVLESSRYDSEKQNNQGRKISNEKTSSILTLCDDFGDHSCRFFFNHRIRHLIHRSELETDSNDQTSACCLLVSTLPSTHLSVNTNRSL